jgi:hypothetical protein
LVFGAENAVVAVAVTRAVPATARAKTIFIAIPFAPTVRAVEATALALLAGHNVHRKLLSAPGLKRRTYEDTVFIIHTIRRGHAN